jgi:hypothetical protein
MADNNKHLLEMYRIGFERLQFQDDYIFKFSALFMAINGGLGYVWKEIYFADVQSNLFLFLIAVFGFLICIIWYMWIKHNDYWHSVWIGCLKNMEEKICPSTLFAVIDEEIAKSGGRKKPCLRGHKIASLLPLWAGIGWLLMLGLLVIESMI